MPIVIRTSEVPPAQRHDLTARLTAVPVSPDEGTAALAAPLLRRVALDLDSYQPAFFSALGLEFFGMTENLASVIISEHTQVMLLPDATFASYASKSVADAAASTEVILGWRAEERRLPVPARLHRPRRTPL